MYQRLKNITILLLATFFFYCCSKQEERVKEAYRLYQEGRFSEAAQHINTILASNTEPFAKDDLVILRKRMNLTRLDFSKTETELRKKLLTFFPELTTEQINAWEYPGKLEMRIIKNCKRYFRNAVPNLFRVDSLARVKKLLKEGEYTNAVATSISTNGATT